MNIGKSFSYVPEDKQWLSKLGLGALITFIPIVNFAWNGYLVQLIRNVMNNSAEPLPNWDDFGKKFIDGLILLAAGLVYSLPVLILICLPLGFMSIPAILSGNKDLADLGNVMMGVGGVFFFCMMIVLLIYSIGLSVIFPAILVLFAREGTFASCFKVREVFDMIGKNAGPFFTAWGISIVAAIGISIVSFILNLFVGWIPCIGQIVSLVISIGLIVYASTVYTHLFGQFGNIAFGQDQSVIQSQ